MFYCSHIDKLLSESISFQALTNCTGRMLQLLQPYAAATLLDTPPTPHPAVFCKINYKGIFVGKMWIHFFQKASSQ